VTIRCGTGPGGQANLEIDPLPRGATFDRGQLRWRPGLDQAGVYLLSVRSGRERAVLEIGVGHPARELPLSL
jgi:hypothetical protein